MSNKGKTAKAENEQTESQIRKVLKNEVTVFMGMLAIVGGFLLGVVKPQYEIKNRIDKIESNHLTHLQMYGEQLVELKEEMVKIEEREDRRHVNYLADKKELDAKYLETATNLEHILTAMKYTINLK